MKTKIIAISLMTVSVIGLSFLLIQNIFQSIDEVEEAQGLISDRPTEFVEEVTKLPEFSKGSGNNNYRAYNADQKESPGFVLPFNSTSADMGYFSTSALPSASSNGYNRSSNQNNTQNYHPVAMIPVLNQGKVRSDKFLALGRGVNREGFAAKLNEPFSGSAMNMTGPMRMEGNGDSPPGEGVPIGEGMALLMCLALFYGLYQMKNKIPAKKVV